MWIKGLRKIIVIGVVSFTSTLLAESDGFGVISPMDSARRLLEEEDIEMSLAEQRVEAKFYSAFGGFKNDMVKPRASKVHDRVTFVVDEDTESSIEANTELKAETKAIWNLNNWFRLTQNDSGDTVLQPYSMKSADGTINSALNTDDYAQVNMDSKHEHKGDGQTTRTNTLTTKLSGEVIQVLPNGSLVVEAKKTVKVNNELQIVTLLGTVNPNDLNDESEVTSSKIIDLKIELLGEGDVSDTIKQGWLSGFVSKFKPF